LGDYKFIVLGSYHSGLLELMPSFDEALNDPVQSELRGCERPSQRLSQGKKVEFPCFVVSVFGTVYRFYRHPELYLMPYMEPIVREIIYNENADIQKPYNEVDTRYLDAKSIYLESLESARKLKEALNNAK